MGLRTLLYSTSLFVCAIESNWQIKIDECIAKYKSSKSLPRKQKKKIRKQLNEDYNFYLKMQKWSINNF